MLGSPRGVHAGKEEIGTGPLSALGDGPRKKAATFQGLSKSLREAVDPLEQAIQQVRGSTADLQKAHGTRWGALAVAEKRLELRTQRADLVQDVFQTALEREHQVVTESCEKLASRVKLGLEMLAALEDTKAEVLAESKALHFKTSPSPRTQLPPPKLPEDGASPAEAIEEPASARGVLMRAQSMEADAHRFCGESQAALKSGARQVELAGAHTGTSMQRHLSEAAAVRKRLAKEVEGTRHALDDAGRSVGKIERQLERQSPSAGPAEGLAQPGWEGGQANTAAAAALPSQLEQARALLCQLGRTELRLAEELQRKTAAWKIDDACARVITCTPSKAEPCWQLLKHSGSRGPLPPLVPDVAQRIRERVRGAAPAERDLLTLFSSLDEDSSGCLREEEVREAFRAGLRITCSDISDSDIAALCAMLDSSGTGTVDIHELVGFVVREPELGSPSALRQAGSRRSGALGSRPRYRPLVVEVLDNLRSKIKAAAYTGHHGRQLDVMFSRFDRDGSGQLENAEVCLALRRSLKIPPSVISDDHIFSLCRLLDIDGSGSVGISEIMDFVGQEPEVSQRTGKLIHECSTTSAGSSKTLSPSQRRRRLEPMLVERVRWHIQSAAQVGAVYNREASPRFAAAVRRLDKAGSGRLEDDQVLEAFRHALRIPPSVISDAEVSSLCAVLDAENVGSVAVSTFLDFAFPRQPVAPPPVQSSSPQASDKLRTKIKGSTVTGTQQDGPLDVLCDKLDKAGSGQLVQPEDEFSLEGSSASPRTAPTRSRAPKLSAELLERLRAKIKAASYTGHEGRQLDVLLGRFDKDHSGHLDYEEVRQALRRTLKIPRDAISDREIALWCASLDRDQSASIDIGEIMSFVGLEPTVSKRTGRDLSDTELASPKCSPTVVSPKGSPRKAKAEVPQLEGEVLDRVRARIKGAAYAGHEGRRLEVLFGRFDADGSGQLSYDEVRRALRRTLRIAKSVVSEDEVAGLCARLDADGSGAVDVAELVAFVGVEPQVSKRSARRLPAIGSSGPAQPPGSPKEGVGN